MNDGNELRDALRVAVPVEPEDKVGRRREVLLSVIEREIALTPGRVEREQSRLRWKRGVRMVSVAAALISTLGLGMLMSEFGADVMRGAESASSPSPSEHAAPSAGHQIHESLAGRTFETRAGHHKVIELGGRTKVTLAAHTKMYVERDTPNEQHVRLSSGGLALSVPPHQKNRSVQVRTKHATVMVTGTVFGVEVGRFSQPSHTEPRTRVTVERGQVIVRHAKGTVTLDSGDIWLSPLQSAASQLDPSPLPEVNVELRPLADSDSISGTPSTEGGVKENRSSTTTTDAARSSTTTTDATRPSTTGSRRPEGASHVDPDSRGASTLAAENNLLERALSAEKRGNDERARELVERFLERYPRSPLRPSALAVRKRLDVAP